MLVVVLLICLVMIVMLQFGFIFLLLALLPTLVAFYTDSDGKRSTFKIVGCGNLAATMPTLVPMLKESMKMKHYDIESVIADPSVWMFIYLGAAAGWGLIFLSRTISRFIVTMTYEYNINALKKQQKQLIEEWGVEISMREEKNSNAPSEETI